MGRNRTSPPPDRPRATVAADRPRVRRLAGPPEALQTMTKDDAKGRQTTDASK